MTNRRTFLATATALLSPRVPTQASPSFIQGVTGPEKKRIAELGAKFRSKFDLPGVSLAMSYRGKLKLLACFGMADKTSRLAVG
ncbi:MAG: hypothetical protein AB8G99_16010, partial [Planctomycetaceae bacterium]